MKRTENKTTHPGTMTHTFRCNICGQKAHDFGQKCPHCGTIINGFTAVDITADPVTYR